MKSFYIPRVPHDQYFEVIIQKIGIEKTPNAIKFRLQKQIIEGLEIPRGFEVMCPDQACLMVTLTPSIKIKGWKLNQILRKVVMDNLRNGKI